MSDGEITREVEGSKGRYVLREGGLEAELTYSILSPARIIADHTGVPDAWRGRGVADRLAARLASDARAEGVRIIPLCPYVNAWRRKHSDWADVFDV